MFVRFFLAWSVMMIMNEPPAVVAMQSQNGAKNIMSRDLLAAVSNPVPLRPEFDSNYRHHSLC